MKDREIEVAISSHMAAFGLAVRARKGEDNDLADLIEREFELRRVLVDSRGDDNGGEIRRVTYMTGFLIASRVSQNYRLFDDVGGLNIETSAIQPP